MKNEESSLKDRINRVMKTPSGVNRDTDEAPIDLQNSYKGMDTEPGFQEYQTAEPGEGIGDKHRRKKMDKPLKVFGAICIAASIIALIFSTSPSVDTSESARNALKNKVSTSISAGTVLSSKDENIGQKDYTISHSSDIKDTKIWVWDYAAEDGDYVQVLVNGAPVSDPFMIRHKPREISIPAAGNVQIKGIRDGGGGITYAVRYDINGTSYFNGAPEGGFNTYTLTKE